MIVSLILACSSMLFVCDDKPLVSFSTRDLDRSEVARGASPYVAYRRPTAAVAPVTNVPVTPFAARRAVDDQRWKHGLLPYRLPDYRVDIMGDVLYESGYSVTLPERKSLIEPYGMDRD